MGIETLIIGGLLAATAGTIYSAQQTKKATAAQNEANDIQRQQNDLSNARAKRDAIRQARTARAQAQQTGENQGVASSSASIGGVGAIGTQVADNLSFLDQYGIMSDAASKSLGKANTAAANASIGQSFASLGLTVASQAVPISGAASKVFGK